MAATRDNSDGVAEQGRAARAGEDRAPGASEGSHAVQAALVERVRALLSSSGPLGWLDDDPVVVREVNMFGGVSFMVNENMAVAVRSGGELLVRTDPARRSELLDLGAEPAMMGAKRQMGTRWASVPNRLLSKSEHLQFWVAEGIRGSTATAGQ